MGKKDVAVPESPQTMHGRLLEAVHVSGYSFERACSELEWLLEEERWKQCGEGFDDINLFLGTIDLSPFKIEASHRKSLAKKLADLEASQRATAKAIGVDPMTVNRDLKDVENATSKVQKPGENRSDKSQSVANSTPISTNGRDAAKAVEQKHKNSEKNATKNQKREAKNERERNAKATKPTLHVCSVSDFHKHIKKSSVDVVITDPPYPREFLPLYSDLSAFCLHALKPGGFLVCMVGQSYLPEIMERLSEHLSYRWSCAYLTPGGQSVQLWDRQVNTFWKPLLVFSKGEANSERWIGDVFQSDVNDNDKNHHHWGQSESGMARIIRAFSEPKETVCDPFLGGGTTALVACDMGRKFVGCDIDETCLESTRKRFA